MSTSTVGGFRGMLERYLSPYEREEKGLAPPDQSNVSGDGTSKHLTTTDAGSLIPTQDKLLVFRALTGIDTVPALTRNGHSVRTAPNIGIYTRVVNAERRAVRGYRYFSLLVNIFLGTQIIVAAILTALGAANGPHTAVTAFGAINTIIAGAMTYLKGSGLPNRFKYHENEWKVIREYIEQRERDFCLVDCALDVYEEIHIVEDMYKRIKAELEANVNGGNYGGSGDRSRNPPPGIKQGEETDTRHHEPRSPAPHTSVPHTSMPHNSVPHNSVPHNSVPHNSVPHTSVPHTSVPHTSVPHTAPHTSHTSVPHTSAPQTTVPSPAPAPTHAPAHVPANSGPPRPVSPLDKA